MLRLIGNTPLIPLHFRTEGLTLHAKCEFLNPSGSIKDRLARCVIVDAQQRGPLRRDSIILECTSGNTGIALAMAGTACGYRVSVNLTGTWHPWAMFHHCSPKFTDDPVLWQRSRFLAQYAAGQGTGPAPLIHRTKTATALSVP